MEKKNNDLISRADAVNEIHKYFVEEINKTPYTKDEDGDEVYTDMPTVNSLLVCNKELAKRINSLPSAEAVQGEWIPVSERMPSAEDCPMDCMVTRRSKYVGNYTDMAVAEADGTWTHEDWKAITIRGEATCISTMDADIIAWMPLPKPYREDGEEE